MIDVKTKVCVPQSFVLFPCQTCWTGAAPLLVSQPGFDRDAAPGRRNLATWNRCQLNCEHIHPEFTLSMSKVHHHFASYTPFLPHTVVQIRIWWCHKGHSCFTRGQWFCHFGPAHWGCLDRGRRQGAVNTGNLLVWHETSDGNTSSLKPDKRSSEFFSSLFFAALEAHTSLWAEAPETRTKFEKLVWVWEWKRRKEKQNKKQDRSAPLPHPSPPPPSPPPAPLPLLLSSNEAGPTFAEWTK